MTAAPVRKCLLIFGLWPTRLLAPSLKMSTGHFNFVQFGFQPRVLTLGPAKNSKPDDSSFDSETFLGGFFVQRQPAKNKIDTSYLVRRQIRIVDPRPQAELAKQNNEEKRHRRA